MMVTADNVSVGFRKGLLRGTIRALDSFSLSVQQGDIFALLGPNGAGKSTAMYCFLGLVRPDQGSVSLFGKTPEPGHDLFRDIAYLPEEPHYHQYLTVEETVRFYARLHGVTGSLPVKKAIDRVGLGEFRDLRMAKCSKGMKQKVGIAQCLINDPKLVFLDEPTRGLDPIAVKEFRDVLVELNKKGATIVLNSHVLSEIEMICNRAAIMNKGRVVVQDEMARLRGTSLEAYQVECAPFEPLPEFLKVLVKTSTSVKGEIPAEKLDEFMRLMVLPGRKLIECTLKRATLEDSFFAVLKGGA
ncbi:MAG: ABC transporter ATP-binding protein [Nitrospiraceae bacterium]|nr:ABC transporter ATP-binding protein [Nitrospiraceae bacterium]